MNVPPIQYESVPQFELPEERGPRHFGGWILLAVFFVLMIGMELVQYMDRGDRPESKYLESFNQLKLGVEMKETGRILGAGTRTDIGEILSSVEKGVEKDAPNNEIAARIFAAARAEQGKEIPQPVIKRLKASKEPRDKVFAEIYSAKTLTKEQAIDFEKRLKGGAFISRLATVQAYEKAGDKSKREQLISSERAYFKVFAMLGVLAAAGLGFVLLIVYGVMKGMGHLPRLGFPLEKMSLPDADRMALRCAQLFAIFLGVQIVVPLLSVAMGPKMVDRHLAMFLTYLLLIVAALAMFRYPVGGKVFTLSDIGVNTKNLGKNVMWGFSAALANLPIVFVMAMLGQWLFAGLPKPEHPTTVEIQGGVGILGTLVIFFAGSIAAPILEEIMFRGTLLPALARVMKRPVVAILLQGFIFAAIHPTGIPAWLPLATIGATSGFLSRQTGSLVPSIVMHAVHNFGTLLFAKALLGMF